MKKLFALLLMTCIFSGCGGGGKDVEIPDKPVPPPTEPPQRHGAFSPEMLPVQLGRLAT